MLQSCLQNPDTAPALAEGFAAAADNHVVFGPLTAIAAAEAEWGRACCALLTLGYDPAKGIVALAAAMKARADAAEAQSQRTAIVLRECAAALRRGEVRPLSEDEAEYTDHDLMEIATSEDLNAAAAAIMLYPRNAIWSSDQLKRLLERWRRRG